MKLNIAKKKLKENIQNIARRCGYILQYQNTETRSYVRPLTRLDYPRFHLYVKENDHDYILTIHLDHKKPVYRGSNSHQGEYDGEIVKKEFNKIKDALL